MDGEPDRPGLLRQGVRNRLIHETPYVENRTPRFAVEHPDCAQQVPTALIGGVPVYGPADSFKISGNALAGLGTAGASKINGVALTPTTPLASIKGSLVAVQGNGTVKVGP